MGKKNRERVERIQSGLEQSISSQERDASSDKVTSLIKTKCPDITNLTEIKVCRQITRYLAVPLVPKHIVKDKLKEGMCKVIAKLEKSGETKESIISFYWGIAEFKELWIKLECSESEWRDLVKSQ